MDKRLKMRKSSLEVAKLAMLSYFAENSLQIYKRKELYSIFSLMKVEWNLALSVTPSGFIDYIIDKINFNKIVFDFPNRRETRYARGKISFYRILLSINSKSYFSHLTALYFNHLLSKEPKEVYWNIEQPKKNIRYKIMNQNNIDISFKNRPKITNNVCEYDGYIINGLNGMNTNNLGVTTRGGIRFTDIERTIIDIVVRPQYSGGMKNTLNVFRKAKSKLDVEKIIKYLKKIKFVYPYHQSIGFYLERTKYPKETIDLFSKMRMRYNFYVMNQIRNPKYSKKWKLYYPSKLDYD